jgi:pseudaminic acid cytidylyltransferase
MRLAIIPARGGSKRIPRKNIRPFFGKPMIVWSINAAQESNCFDRIIVSTDDAEISEIAQAAGCEAPFVRPQSLSDDHTGTVPVIAHAVEWALTQGLAVREACCIYAASPFVRASDLRRGLETLQQQACDYVFPVTSFPAPVQRAVKVNENGRLEMFDPRAYETRSQDLEEAYHDAGQFYWGTRDAWLGLKSVFLADSVPLILPRNRVQDIDTEEDWLCAELMFQAFNERAEQDQVRT